MINQLFEKLFMYFQFPFVRYALIAGILIALCSSLLGVILVLKQFSFIGDGLSHVAFGAITIASVANISNNMPLVLFITIFSAILMLRIKRNSKFNADSLIAMISTGSLALGYLFMNIFSSSSNLSGDVCTTLFGSISILTLTINEVYLCVILSIFLVLIFIALYNKIFSVVFDEDFAAATGLNTNFYNLIVAIMAGSVIVLAMKLAGSLLISALVVFPAISAMRVFKTFKSVIICAVILSMFCALIGMLIAILVGTPVGSTIVSVDIVAFFIFYAIGKFKSGGI